MLNYKADGTPFQNSLHVAPIRCSGGKVRFPLCLPSQRTYVAWF